MQHDELVTLRNGRRAPRGLVETVQIGLRNLRTEDPAAWHQLVSFCRYPRQRLDVKTVRCLQARGFLEKDGTIRDGVRNSVISASRGRDWFLKLVDPIDPDTEQEEKTHNDHRS